MRNTGGGFCSRLGARFPGRRRTTGQGANRATRSATLPIKYRSNPVRPSVNSMMESHCDSRAAETISSALCLAVFVVIFVFAQHFQRGEPLPLPPLRDA